MGGGWWLVVGSWWLVEVVVVMVLVVMMVVVMEVHKPGAGLELSRDVALRGSLETTHAPDEKDCKQPEQQLAAALQSQSLGTQCEMICMKMLLKGGHPECTHRQHLYRQQRKMTHLQLHLQT